MKFTARLPFIVALSIAACVKGDDTVDSQRAAFLAAVSARVEAKPGIRGDDKDWFFPVKELRHLASGRFWEKPWQEVAANRSDPTAGIVEFRKLLDARGVRLILVPVPPKASIYPEKLARGFGAGAPEPIGPFLGRLREAGVEVINLEPYFREMAGADPGNLLYCRQDAHFSPYAAERVAALIAKALNASPGDVDGGFEVTAAESVVFTGDQIVGSEWEGTLPPEALPVRKVVKRDGSPVEPDAESPLLLLGDSHTLVFQAGEEEGMLCRGAGVFDHLAAGFGYAPDLVGVRGSGMVQARKQLFYKASASPGYWARKKVVIWLFSAREFTQSSDRPVSIPLDRSPVGGGEK